VRGVVASEGPPPFPCAPLVRSSVLVFPGGLSPGSQALLLLFSLEGSCLPCVPLVPKLPGLASSCIVNNAFSSAFF
jgi:hypothetical protein